MGRQRLALLLVLSCCAAKNADEPLTPPPSTQAHVTHPAAPRIDPEISTSTERLVKLATPDTATPGLLAGVLAGKDDPCCRWDIDSTVCLQLALTFKPGSAVMEGNYGHQLKELARFLKENPGARIDLIGHADVEGDAEENLRLSKARALAVRRYLRNEGIEKSRINAKALGDLAPAAPNATPAGRHENRRVMAILTFYE